MFKSYWSLLRQKIIFLLGKYYLSNLTTLIILNLKLYKLLLPHDIDFYALNHFKKYISNNDILDIGGHYGLAVLSIRFAGYKKNRIHVFEPNLNNINILNKIKDSRVKIYKFGLSNKNNNKGILITPKKIINHTSLSTLEFNNLNDFKKIKNIKFLKSKVILKKYDSINIKSNIKFIKIDIEGHEYKALRGMIKTIYKNLPIIMVEKNKNNFYKIKSLLGKKYVFKTYNLKKKCFVDITHVKNDIDLNTTSKNYFLIPKKIKLL